MLNVKGPKKNSLGKGITSLLGEYEEEKSAKRIQGQPNQKNLPEKPQEIKAGATLADRQSESSDSDSLKNNQIVQEVVVQNIIANPHQPRRVFKKEEIEALARSIAVDGLIQPITVMRLPQQGKFQLIAGERRLRATVLLGKTTIPAIIRKSMTEQEQLRVALIENIQRQDLNVVEEAEAYQSLIQDFGLTQEQCAEKVGKERSTVANILRILVLPKEVQEDVVDGRLTTGHARALIVLENKIQILRARDTVVKKQLTVRQTESLVKELKDALNGDVADNGNNKSTNNPDLSYLAEGLRNKLNTRVKILGSNSKGRIEIAYFSPSELERLMKCMGYQI
jgi:ParB family chromosome partitioning protein